MDERAELLERAAALIAEWEQRFGPVEAHPASAPDAERLERAWATFAERMGDHYPFFHPRFAGQMLKPPHRVAAAGYLAAMLVNPNNHALDGGPGTTALEVEAVDALADMFGLARPRLGHLTSSGTIANLEALWVAREMTGGKAVVHSALAHYTHDRMCRLLGVEPRAVPADAQGRIDLDAVAAQCARGDVGTVVLTAGTTGLGAIDRIDEALALRERYGVRLHVDAAYGGFFALLADDDLVARAPFAAIASCDSVVVDPHKHGLQPYGCGAVLFADPSVAAVYAHESPYTYFVPADLHLGEISLECSRAGAAAAALWLTLQVFPLRRDDGLGPMLAASRRAALRLAALLRSDAELTLHVEPELDIVTYFPSRAALSAVDAATDRALAAGMADAADPVFLSTIRVTADAFAQLHPAVARDAEAARVLRSVLMKPEHETTVERLHARLSRLAAEVTTAR
jgi:glutamate/tyrosine decarboxylase-like PLP-dependent enzyme